MLPNNLRADEAETLREDASTIPMEDQTPDIPAVKWRGPVRQAGNQFGAYRLLRLLGRGGFSEVWQAEDTRNGRHVALKVLTILPAPSSEMLKRFQREGQLAAAVNHPRSVYVFGSEEIQGYAAIT